jgi:hypothetical protein
MTDIADVPYYTITGAEAEALRPDGWIPTQPFRCPECRGTTMASQSRRHGPDVIRRCARCKHPQGFDEDHPRLRGRILLGEPLDSPYGLILDYTTPTEPDGLR